MIAKAGLPNFRSGVHITRSGQPGEVYIIRVVRLYTPDRVYQASPTARERMRAWLWAHRSTWTIFETSRKLEAYPVL